MGDAVLRLSAAGEVGLRKDQVYALVESGHLDRVGRGVYVDPDEIDPAWAVLAGATALQSKATLCLTSALVYHGLSDAIPYTTDIALPRGTRHPAGFDNATWHSFDPVTFDVGRTSIGVAGLELAVYCPERTLIDCFRLAYSQGADQAYTALRRWVGRRGSQPSVLLDLAREFPKARPSIMQALEVLL
jgi:predicted transcriptional regulator of viral defense system